MFKEYFIYDEAERLLSSFTFGFELEGWIDERYDSDEFKNFAGYTFEKFDILNNSKPEFKEDSSINPDGFEECYECNGSGTIEYIDEDGDEQNTNCEECGGTGYLSRSYDGPHFTFELSSPIIRLTPINIINTVKFLTEAIDTYNVETNETCGFHIHVGFPEINSQIRAVEIFWSLCNFINNPDEFTKFLNFKGIKFYDTEFANINWFNDLYDKITYQYSKYNFRKIDILNFLSKYYSSAKYVIFRQHPQGTLEWRGPRGFMNHSDLYKEFFVKVVYKLVTLLNDYLDKTEIVMGSNVITKKEFFEYFMKIEDYPSNIDKIKKFIEMTPEEIAEVYRKFPRILNQIEFSGARLSIENDKLLIREMYLNQGNLSNVFIDNIQLNDASINNCNINNLWVHEKAKISDCEIQYINKLEKSIMKNCNINFMYASINNATEFDNCNIQKVESYNLNEVIFNKCKIKLSKYGGRKNLNRLLINDSELEFISDNYSIISSEINNSTINNSTINSTIQNKISFIELNNCVVKNFIINSCDSKNTTFINCKFENFAPRAFINCIIDGGTTYVDLPEEFMQSNTFIKKPKKIED